MVLTSLADGGTGEKLAIKGEIVSPVINNYYERLCVHSVTEMCRIGRPGYQLAMLAKSVPVGNTWNARSRSFRSVLSAANASSRLFCPVSALCGGAASSVVSN